MAREMLLAGVDPDDLKKNDAPPPPQNFRQRWENYWYHHKWSTIAILFLVAVLTVFMVQTLTRNDPDYTVLVVTGEHNEYSLSPLQGLLERYGEDLDGDGQVEVRLAACHLSPTQYNGAQEQVLNYQILQSHLASGDVMLFAFEEEYFGWFMGEMGHGSEGFLTPLGVQGDGVSPDGYYWDWSGDPRVAGNTAFEGLPDRLYFGVRVATGTAAGRTEEQQQCLALLRRLIADQSTH